MDNKEIPKGSFYEFFAGGGMARAGLGSGWSCLFANDIDEKKAATYVLNWGDRELKVDDVGALSINDLPDVADLAWASFPCQDLSLAGVGAGLKGARSGTFWPFWDLIRTLRRSHKAPALIVLENVCGALTSHKGQDFRTLIEALADENYRFGALVIDAVHFVPQSRPRLFIVAVRGDVEVPAALTGKSCDSFWSSAAMINAYESLNPEYKRQWIWWKLPRPTLRRQVLSDLIEEKPTTVAWHSKAETKRLIELMSLVNRQKLQAAKKLGHRIVGGVYKRTRVDASGSRAQRAEVRFDDIAGCLRTPVGGSSRQLIMVVEGDRVRSRLLSPREAARLMGLPEEYRLPKNYNEAYHIAGDGLAVPVVRHLAAHVLEPLLSAIRAGRKEAA